LQKQIEAMQKQMGTPTGNPEALDKLKKDLEKLKEAAKSMASKNSPGSEAERQKLSESMSALSKQMQEMGVELPQLDDAIKALEANQTDLVLKDLEASLTDLVQVSVLTIDTTAAPAELGAGFLGAHSAGWKHRSKCPSATGERSTSNS
jgi:chromosome segregation ATPase